MLHTRSSEDPNRQHYRFPAQGKVMLRPLGGEGPRLTGLLLDLSGGGAQIALNQPMMEGTVVSMTLLGASAKGKRSVNMVGQVVFARREEDRYIVGVEFGWEADPGSGVRSKAGLWPWVIRQVSGRPGSPRPTPKSPQASSPGKKPFSKTNPSTLGKLVGRISGAFRRK